MGNVLALFRADWHTALTYRFQFAISLGGIVLSAIPLYFVSGALQPVMQDVIVDQGEQYFSFLVVGLATYFFLVTSVTAIPAAIASSIRTGTLEAMLATPASIPSLLAGMAANGMVWATIRAGILLLAAIALGGTIVWPHLPLAAAIIVLIVAAHVPIGLAGAAMVLLFRTPGPLGKLVLTGSGLMGGVYFPTSVVPSWLHDITAVVPLTYGLRALRQTLLEGAPLPAVAADLLVLCAFAVALTAGAVLFFRYALRSAKHRGTLAQY